MERDFREGRRMQVRVGCDFHCEAPGPTPSIMQVEPHDVGAHQVRQQHWETAPVLPLHEYRDLYGNTCRRFTMPAGQLHLHFDALVDVPDTVDDMDTAAQQLPVEDLPDEALIYTMPSRYCLSDVLSDTAWQLFGDTAPGWERVQAICDWVHNHIHFQYGSSTPMTTAVDVYEQCAGVCRDFTHLGVTFCRAMNIPARYTFGYLPDIGVPPPAEPMDFCAWFEAYLGDRWWTFDPRNNIPRTGRVVIGRGRDALDVAMLTTFGPHTLHQMIVLADEAEPASSPGPAAAEREPSR
jgi:transglutaminase-like putative cysteine protease